MVKRRKEITEKLGEEQKPARQLLLVVAVVCTKFKITEFSVIDIKKRRDQKKALKRWMKSEFQGADKPGSLGIAERNDRYSDQKKVNRKSSSQ